LGIWYYLKIPTISQQSVNFKGGLVIRIKLNFLQAISEWTRSKRQGTTGKQQLT